MQARKSSDAVTLNANKSGENVINNDVSHSEMIYSAPVFAHPLLMKQPFLDNNILKNYRDR